MKTLHGYGTVTWIDSSRQEGLTPQSGLPTPTEVFSAGYIVADTDDYITLARDLVGDFYQGLLSIPTRSIVTRRTLFVHFNENDGCGQSFPPVDAHAHPLGEQIAADTWGVGVASSNREGMIP